MGHGVCSGHVLCWKVILVSILTLPHPPTLCLPYVNLSMLALTSTILLFRAITNLLLALVESAVDMVTRVSLSTSVSKTPLDPIPGDI